MRGEAYLTRPVLWQRGMNLSPRLFVQHSIYFANQIWCKHFTINKFINNNLFFTYFEAIAPSNQDGEPYRWLYGPFSEREEGEIFIQTVILPTNGREQQWNGENVRRKWKSMAHIWKENEIHKYMQAMEFHGGSVKLGLSRVNCPKTLFEFEFTWMMVLGKQ